MRLFHLWYIIMNYWERGEACPMAVAIGVDPWVMMATSTHIPFEQDEFALAGALKGKPIDMVKCETVPRAQPHPSGVGDGYQVPGP